mgnify:CR=1 FL=1
MANQNLIDRLNLEREITELTRERSNISKQAEKDMQNRVSLLQKIVSAEGDNVKLGHAQKDLRKKSTEFAKKGHTIQANQYKQLAKTVTKQIQQNKEAKAEAEVRKKLHDETVKQATAVTNMAKGLAGVVGLGGGLMAIFSKFNAMTKTIGKNFGALGMTNQQFKNDMLEAGANATLLGQNIEDVAAVQKDLTDNFGFGRDESVAMAQGVMDTSMALGLSNQEGTKLLGTLTQVAGMSFDTAQNFSKQVALLADAEGVSPTTVMRDIANSSESIAKFSGMNTNSLAKAAIQATKLGTNLDTIAGSMEGMLNFQDSLNNEIEASIILGRNVNLQKARELALAGKAEEFAVELTKQVGSQAEFEQMNVLQRQSLAKALGINVEQMAKMVRNQDKVYTLGEAISKQEGLEGMIGRKAMDNMAQIIADLQRVGAELIISIGPMVGEIAAGIANFTKGLYESKVVIPLITSLMGLMLGKSIMNFAFSIATALGKQAFKMGPLGIGLILGIPALVGGLVGSLKQVGDLSISGGKTMVSTAEGGLFELSPNDDLVAGPGVAGAVAGGGGGNIMELKRETELVKTEISKLRQEMSSYFGVGGSAIRGIGSRVGDTLKSM